MKEYQKFSEEAVERVPSEHRAWAKHLYIDGFLKAREMAVEIAMNDPDSVMIYDLLDCLGEKEV